MLSCAALASHFCTLQEVLTPDEPAEVICEMIAFTNLSVLQAAHCTHFRRHEIDRGSTDAPSNDSSTSTDKFDGTIMEAHTC